jgi:hypothetical protein
LPVVVGLDMATVGVEVAVEVESAVVAVAVFVGKGVDVTWDVMLDCDAGACVARAASC